VGLPAEVGLREVVLREGMQSDPRPVRTEEKVAIAQELIAAGFKSINPVSLVSPKAMPHMADAEAVLEGIGPQRDVMVSALIPNERGVRRALECAERELIREALFVHATTPSVLRVNGLPPDLEENLSRVLAMAREAQSHGLRTVVFISASFGCSMEGRVDPAKVRSIADRLYGSDSTGQADPRQVTEFFDAVLPRLEGRPFTVHFHDSRGAALANAYALLQLGPRGLTLDCALAGLGGDVHFLPQAAGNVCTEDLLQMLKGLGVATGVDLAAALSVSQHVVDLYPGRYIPSRTLPVGAIAWK